MTFICEFCCKDFATKSSLNNHKIKTKYCLQIQKEKGIIDSAKGEEICIHCNKSFYQKNSKLMHEKICKDRISLEIESKNRICHDLLNTYENDIKVLKDDRDFYKLELERKEYFYKLELDKKDDLIKLLLIKEDFYKSELSKKDDLVKLSIEKSGVVNNTTMTTSSSNKQINKQVNVMNCLDLSDERLKKAADNYTFDHYNRAEAGMVDWCINNVIKDKDEMLYRCTDKNRRVFTFKTILGDTILDPNATQLKSSIKPILAEKLKGYKKINCKLMGEDSDDDNNEKVDAYLRLHAINKEMGIEFEKELVKKTYNIT